MPPRKKQGKTTAGVPLKADSKPTGDAADKRALALGVDSAGGYLVPKQLDGKKKRKPRKRK